ncbi:MAG: Ppx/GppA family phosphatase [Pseudomonadota bacterium]
MGGPEALDAKALKRMVARPTLGASPARKVGVVDVGSNSVRLVIFDGIARSPSYFFNEKALCGLGAGLAETGVLNPQGRRLALEALSRFARILTMQNVTQVDAVATAAVREAQDGPDFVREVAHVTGLQLQVIDGLEEAQLSARGVLLGWPRANGIVCDIGGASMEMARLDKGKIQASASSALGPLQLEGLKGKALTKRIDAELETLVDAVGTHPANLYLVGGSWRALGRLDMERRRYPLKVLHEYRMSPKAIASTARWAYAKGSASLGDYIDSSEARLSLVPLAAAVMQQVLKVIEPKAVKISAFGLREGVLYDAMPERLRERDPLLEASRQMEFSSARVPGFGAELYAWLKPLFAHASTRRRRIIKAACFLHDITWRAHPDYRAQMCFETVTRAGLTGLDHGERVYLGLALLNRYKTGIHGQQLPERLLKLLEEETAHEAALVGKAMRLGAMVSGGALGVLPHAPIALEDGVLRLRLYGPVQDLVGHAVHRRLSALASRMGAEPLVDAG